MALRNDLLQGGDSEGSRKETVCPGTPRSFLQFNPVIVDENQYGGMTVLRADVSDRFQRVHAGQGIVQQNQVIACSYRRAAGDASVGGMLQFQTGTDHQALDGLTDILVGSQDQCF